MDTQDLNWAQYFPKEEWKLGDYLAKSGRPVNCRLDFRLTRLEELKKAAFIVSELNKVLQKYAYGEGDAVTRIMVARQLFARASFDLKYKSAESAKKYTAKQALEAKNKAAPPVVAGAVVEFGDVKSSLERDSGQMKGTKN